MLFPTDRLDQNLCMTQASAPKATSCSRRLQQSRTAVAGQPDHLALPVRVWHYECYRSLTLSTQHPQLGKPQTNTSLALADPEGLQQLHRLLQSTTGMHRLYRPGSQNGSNTQATHTAIHMLLHGCTESSPHLAFNNCWPLQTGASLAQHIQQARKERTAQLVHMQTDPTSGILCDLI